MNFTDNAVPLSTDAPGQQPQASAAETSFGQLALAATWAKLPLQVCSSRAGFYLGTYDDEGPCSRESVQYWPTKALAEQALATGMWTQRLAP